MLDEAVVGVVVVGRPVARMSDNGWTVEITRLATDGSRNACSMLYSAAWRADQEVSIAEQFQANKVTTPLYCRFL